MVTKFELILENVLKLHFGKWARFRSLCSGSKIKVTKLAWNRPEDSVYTVYSKYKTNK